MGKGEPVPVLSEHSHSDNGGNVQATSRGLQTNSNIATASINDSQGQSSSKLCHSVLMLISDHGLDIFANLGNLRIHLLILLNKDHSRRDKRTLANKVGRILNHRLQEVDCFIETSSSTGNSQGKRGTVSDMRVIALAEKLNHARNGTGLAEKNEAQAHDRNSPDIIVYIAHGNVEKLSNSLVAAGSTVCQGDCHDTSITQDRVLIVKKGVDKFIGALLATKLNQCHTD